MWSLEQEEANSETGSEKPVLFFQEGILKMSWLREVENENAAGFFYRDNSRSASSIGNFPQ
jgi:hypothetical protein